MSQSNHYTKLIALQAVLGQQKTLDKRKLTVKTKPMRMRGKKLFSTLVVH